MQITGMTDLFFIVGAPVSHFRSTTLFTDYHTGKGHDFSAAALHVRSGELAGALDTVRRCDNIKGLCITIPHKIDAVPMMDQLTEAAQRVGSVNFVRREADGTLTGHNIDGQGFMRGLASSGFVAEGADVVLVGVGGVGRAIAFSLANAGIRRLTLLNRDHAKAVALARELAQIVDVSVADSATQPDLSKTTLLVNATSLGMTGNEFMPLSIAGLNPVCFVADVVIKPDVTVLLATAQSLGCKTMGGAAMLMPQIELCEEFLYG